MQNECRRVITGRIRRSEPYLSILDVNEKIRRKFLNDMMETLEML